MPGTLTLAQTGEPSIRDLNLCERIAALYASDMPSSFKYRKGDDAKVCAWMFQGAARLGAEELHRTTAYTGGYLLLRLREQNTPGHDAAHLARFPDQERFQLAQDEAAMVTFRHGASAEAIERSRHVMFETARVDVAVAA
ncbi:MULTISPECIES: hypothetical protein [Streptomyces]|uniref:AraC family transcriptional regulator n=2 Tax=Streptomyces TaxID=1883 RepID=A0ABU4KCH4_9ACTN|nr:hypothetical protein [Streptomyces roseolus]MDX2295392.1 hypothetical protein [Streptomyces roseolus]